MIQNRFFIIVLAMVSGFGSVSAEPSTNTWFRIDSDRQGPILWVGGQNGNWVHDFIFIPGPGWVQADVGRLFSVVEGNDLQPMLGFQHDPIAGKGNYAIPQVFWFSNGERHSSELWAFYYLGLRDGFDDYTWLLWMERWKVTEFFRFGPQFESFYNLETDKPIASCFGAGVKLSYGAKGSVDLSISADIDSKSTTGRLTWLYFLE